LDPDAKDQTIPPLGSIDPLKVSLSALADGKEVAAGGFEMIYVSPDVERIPGKDGKLRGAFFRPQAKGEDPAGPTWGGPAGGNAGGQRAGAGGRAPGRPRVRRAQPPLLRSRRPARGPVEHPAGVLRGGAEVAGEAGLRGRGATGRRRRLARRRTGATAGESL